jgi:hypothetical protein
MTDTNPQGIKNSNTQPPASDTARQNAAQAVRQATQAAQQSGHAAGETLRRAGDADAETVQRSAEVGVEATQRAGNAASEMLHRGSEAFADSQRQFFRTTGKHFEEMSRKMAQAAQGSTEDLHAFMILPNAAHGGLQDLSQSMTGLIDGVVRTNLRATQELLQLANPSAFIELQQRFVREYLDVLMQGTATLVRATRRTADETLRPLEQQIEQRQQANQNLPYQHAGE